MISLNSTLVDLYGEHMTWYVLVQLFCYSFRYITSLQFLWSSYGDIFMVS
jgi:hypothetical protein